MNSNNNFKNFINSFADYSLYLPRTLTHSLRDLIYSLKDTLNCDIVFFMHTNAMLLLLQYNSCALRHYRCTIGYILANHHISTNSTTTPNIYTLYDFYSRVKYRIIPYFNSTMGNCYLMKQCNIRSYFGIMPHDDTIRTMGQMGGVLNRAPAL